MNQPVIYLLDDDPEMLILLSDMAEDIEIKTICFERATEFFIQVTKFSQHSIMVLDLNMPEMDGIEVMRRLAGMPNPPALILISGHDVGVLHSAEKLGSEHKLNIITSLDKPIHLSRFQKSLTDYCKNIGKISSISTPLGSPNSVQEEELLYALNNEQMVLYFQPQFDIKTQKITGCEALVRWLHPQKGIIFPDEFIPLIEKNGWMALLTSLVIREAIKQVQNWNNKNFPTPISVNISADDITSLSLPEQLSELLEENKFDPTMLTLEVTESALMGELVTSLDILTRLRLKGIELSIDDFGTGYSSLSQLHKIPFSELKIDRSFVMSMLQDKEARAIVKTCILLGHELNMKIVAEGVESEKHLEILSDMGCDIAQGYYFCRPLSAEDMTDYLHKHN